MSLGAAGGHHAATRREIHYRMTTTVLVVDDHEAYRHAVRGLLESAPGITIIGEANSADAAVAAVAELAPDVALVDVVLGGSSGIEATRRIAGGGSGARVIGLSIHADEILVAEMVAAGAAGFVAKEAAGEELPAAIRAVAAGGTFFGSSLDG